MTTGTAGVWERQDPRQVANTLKRTTRFNDVGIGASNGVAWDNYLPQSAFILRVLTEIVTAFKAVTTNVYTVGANAGSINNIVAAGDVNPLLAGVYESTRSYGRALTAAAPILPASKYTQSGTAATAGVAITVIEFEGGWAT